MERKDHKNKAKKNYPDFMDKQKFERKQAWQKRKLISDT